MKDLNEVVEKVKGVEDGVTNLIIPLLKDTIKDSNIHNKRLFISNIALIILIFVVVIIAMVLSAYQNNRYAEFLSQFEFEGGAYEVHFDGNVTSATAGQVALALFADGVEVPGTEMNATIAAPGDYENISFSKVIRVCCKGVINLAITSLPTVVYDTTITDTQIPIIKNANIYIERLG